MWDMAWMDRRSRAMRFPSGDRDSGDQSRAWWGWMRPVCGRAELESVFARVAGRFSRVDLRWRMRDYVRGLLGPVERKNGWQLAEYAGHRGPAGFQHLLNGASWDVDALRDDVQQYVADQLGCPDGVLVVDDTGFLKKGTTSAGVQRQYSGTAGRTENCHRLCSDSRY